MQQAHALVKLPEGERAAPQTLPEAAADEAAGAVRLGEHAAVRAKVGGPTGRGAQGAPQRGAAQRAQRAVQLPRQVPLQGQGGTICLPE